MRALAARDNWQTTKQAISGPGPKTGALVLDEEDSRLERKRSARRLRSTAARVWPEEAVARCGHFCSGTHEIAGDHGASLLVGDGGARLGGVVTCQSVWLCPVCAAKIASQRREQVKALVQDHQKRGGTVVLLTLTQAHHWSDPLEKLVKGLTERWSKLRRRPRVHKAEQAMGLRGGIRALEMTRGSNGWHPHLHLLLFVGGDDRYHEYHAMQSALHDLVDVWREACDNDGVCASLNAQKWEIANSPEDAGDYIVKFGSEAELTCSTVVDGGWSEVGRGRRGGWDAAAELTHSHLKSGNGSRTPWDILRDFQDHGWHHDAGLLQEYGATMKGRRQLTTWGDVKLGEIETPEEEDRRALNGDGEEVALLALPAWAIDAARKKMPGAAYSKLELLLRTTEQAWASAMPAGREAATRAAFEAAYTVCVCNGWSVSPPENIVTRWGQGRPRKKQPPPDDGEAACYAVAAE